MAQKKSNKKISIDDLAVMVNKGFEETRLDINGLKDDVSGLKNDVSGLKDDVYELKFDVDERLSSIENILLDFKSRVDTMEVHIKELQFNYRQLLGMKKGH